MTSTESLEKLARSDWKAEMQATFKLIRERGKTQEKDIANHNKKALEQEKRERALDKRHAAEKKKAEAEAEKQLVQWRREMAGLGKFAMEEMEKSKKKKLPEKAKATRAAKSTRLRERSERNQQSKEGETPKRKGSRRNRAKSDKRPSTDSDSLDQEYFDFSMLSPNSPNVQAGPTPTPHPIQKAKTHNDTMAPISLVANSRTTVSTPEQPQLQPQPQLKPQPRPRPRPVKKNNERNISPTHSNQEKSPSTPAWHPRR